MIRILLCKKLSKLQNKNISIGQLINKNNNLRDTNKFFLFSVKNKHSIPIFTKLERNFKFKENDSIQQKVLQFSLENNTKDNNEKTSSFQKKLYNAGIPQAYQNDKIQFQKVVLNPVQSLHSQQKFNQLISIMRIRTVEAFVQFYFDYSKLLNPRLLSTAARIFCSLIQKEKYNRFQQKSLKRIQFFLSDIFRLKIDIESEEIKKQEIKNLLYFLKKILNQHSIALGFNLQFPKTYNSKLYEESQNLYSQLKSILLSQSFDYSSYQVNQFIEIYYNLIKLSPHNQTPKIYQAIIRNKQKIEENVNPQFLFSTGNFLLAVKNIQYIENNQIPNENNSIFKENNQQKMQNNDKLFKNKKIIQNPLQKQENIKKLRQQCYQIFFDKWLYYYEDMSDFIKLQDLKNSWPLILQSYTAIKIIMQNNKSIQTFQVIQKILNTHKIKIYKFWENYPKVLANTFILLHLMSKRLVKKDATYAKKMKEKFIKKVSTLPESQQQKTMKQIKNFSQLLRKQNIISYEQLHELADEVNKKQ